MLEIGLQGKIETFRFVDLCVYDLYRPKFTAYFSIRLAKQKLEIKCPVKF